MGKIGIEVSSVKNLKVRFSLHLVMHLVNREESWYIPALEDCANFLKNKLSNVKFLFREENIEKSREHLMRLSRDEIEWWFYSKRKKRRRYKILDKIIESHPKFI